MPRHWTHFSKLNGYMHGDIFFRQRQYSNNIVEQVSLYNTLIL